MLLALDTASRMISLALHDGRQIRYEASWYSANNHTIELAPAIQWALTQTQMEPTDLTAIAVSQGPGSFTGLRIGMGVAKGLALTQRCALVAVPTLDIVAASAPAYDGQLLAVLQAGRGRICAQCYRWQAGHWTPTGDAVITAWDKHINALDQSTLVVGEIDEVGYDLLQTTEKPIQQSSAAYALRRAGFLAEIAWTRVRNDMLDDPGTVTPIYLHQPGVSHP